MLITVICETLPSAMSPGPKVLVSHCLFLVRTLSLWAWGSSVKHAPFTAYTYVFYFNSSYKKGCINFPCITSAFSFKDSYFHYVYAGGGGRYTCIFSFLELQAGTELCPLEKQRGLSKSHPSLQHLQAFYKRETHSYCAHRRVWLQAQEYNRQKTTHRRQFSSSMRVPELSQGVRLAQQAVITW